MNSEEFSQAHIDAKAQVADGVTKDAITRFTSAAMNLKPIDPIDALVVAYALQSVGKIKGGLGAIGMKRIKSNTYNIDDLPNAERDEVIGICLRYKAKVLKSGKAIDAIAMHFDENADRKTLEKILKDGAQRWGGLIDFLRNNGSTSLEIANFLNVKTL